MSDDTTVADSTTIPAAGPRYVSLPDGQRVYGGSFFHAPDPGTDWLLTVNLMKERELACDVWVPIQDYSTPDGPGALVPVFERILSGQQDVYVGCWGGVGRTGLFMASLLRYLGDPDPVTTVRANYNEHAVETAEQAKFVADFPLRPAPRAAMKP